MHCEVSRGVKAGYVCGACALTGRLMTYKHTYIHVNGVGIGFASTGLTALIPKIGPCHNYAGLLYSQTMHYIHLIHHVYGVRTLTHFSPGPSRMQSACTSGGRG